MSFTYFCWDAIHILAQVMSIFLRTGQFLLQWLKEIVLGVVFSSWIVYLFLFFFFWCPWGHFACLIACLQSIWAMRCEVEGPLLWNQAPDCINHWFSDVCTQNITNTSSRKTFPFSCCPHILGFVRLRWSSFPSIRLVIHPVIHPSKFLIPEEEDDGRGGAGMAAATIYPNVYVIQSCSLWKTPVVLQFAKSYKLIFKN